MMAKTEKEWDYLSRFLAEMNMKIQQMVHDDLPRIARSISAWTDQVRDLLPEVSAPMCQFMSNASIEPPRWNKPKDLSIPDRKQRLWWHMAKRLLCATFLESKIDTSKLPLFPTRMSSIKETPSEDDPPPSVGLSPEPLRRALFMVENAQSLCGNSDLIRSHWNSLEQPTMSLLAQIENTDFFPLLNKLLITLQNQQRQWLEATTQKALALLYGPEDNPCPHPTQAEFVTWFATLLASEQAMSTMDSSSLLADVPAPVRDCSEFGSWWDLAMKCVAELTLLPRPYLLRQFPAGTTYDGVAMTMFDGDTPIKGKSLEVVATIYPAVYNPNGQLVTPGKVVTRRSPQPERPRQPMISTEPAPALPCPRREHHIQLIVEALFEEGPALAHQLTDPDTVVRIEDYFYNDVAETFDESPRLVHVGGQVCNATHSQTPISHSYACAHLPRLLTACTQLEIFPAHLPVALVSVQSTRIAIFVRLQPNLGVSLAYDYVLERCDPPAITASPLTNAQIVEALGKHQGTVYIPSRGYGWMAEWTRSLLASSIPSWRPAMCDPVDGQVLAGVQDMTLHSVDAGGKLILAVPTPFVGRLFSLAVPEGASKLPTWTIQATVALQQPIVRPLSLLHRDTLYIIEVAPPPQGVGFPQTLVCISYSLSSNEWHSASIPTDKCRFQDYTRPLFDHVVSCGDCIGLFSAPPRGLALLWDGLRTAAQPVTPPPGPSSMPLLPHAAGAATTVDLGTTKMIVVADSLSDGTLLLQRTTLPGWEWSSIQVGPVATSAHLVSWRQYVWGLGGCAPGNKPSDAVWVYWASVGAFGPSRIGTHSGIPLGSRFAQFGPHVLAWHPADPFRFNVIDLDEFTRLSELCLESQPALHPLPPPCRVDVPPPKADPRATPVRSVAPPTAATPLSSPDGDALQPSVAPPTADPQATPLRSTGENATSPALQPAVATADPRTTPLRSPGENAASPPTLQPVAPPTADPQTVFQAPEGAPLQSPMAPVAGEVSHEGTVSSPA
ncbi:hypothetical protein PAPYR_5843 [Paratrimastix pyriformis]|uniref:Uncharacterized protein n=1 Tax=Paratrimastix pyriformis TaxID=342808 RepID=A0ABQ8ULS7_9EUKA|nr:hypothetical protein PAPYR_5843 [Paratrimastix pyriformis]